MSDDSETLGQSDQIRLSRRFVAVPWAQRKELMDRLEAAGHGEAVERLRGQRTFTEDQKPQVFEVLNQWLDELKAEHFSPHLMDLRRELHRDITER